MSSLCYSNNTHWEAPFSSLTSHANQSKMAQAYTCKGETQMAIVALKSREKYYLIVKIYTRKRHCEKHDIIQLSQEVTPRTITNI